MVLKRMIMVFVYMMVGVNTAVASTLSATSHHSIYYGQSNDELVGALLDELYAVREQAYIAAVKRLSRDDRVLLDIYRAVNIEKMKQLLSQLEERSINIAGLETIGKAQGVIETQFVRVSTRDNLGDPSQQGIQTGVLNTVIDAGDIRLSVGGNTAIDLAAKKYGGRLILSAESGQDSSAAKKIAERINHIYQLQNEGTERNYLHADAKTVFKPTELSCFDLELRCQYRLPEAELRKIASNIQLKMGDLVINGFSIDKVTSNNYPHEPLSSAINHLSVVTGVYAKISDGYLTLYTKDGRDILLNASKHAADQLFGYGIIGAYQNGLNNLRITGSVTITSEQTLHVFGRALSDAGFDTVMSGTQPNQQGGGLHQVDFSDLTKSVISIDILNQAILDVKTFPKGAD